MTSDAVMAAELAADAFAVTGRLRALWPALAEARHPGRPGTHLLVTRRLSDWQAAVEDDLVRRDRRAAQTAIREGRVPSGEHPVPVRLAPVQARWQIARAVQHVARAVGVKTPVLGEPGLRDCPWCQGSGRCLRPSGWSWSWPGATMACGLCRGHGRWCEVCRVPGGCSCTLADVVVDALLDGLSVALPEVAGLAVARLAATTLGRAERLARQALNLMEADLRVLAAPCPACERRDLAVDVTSLDRRAWSITCQSVLCRCTGPSCGCGRPTRWEGRKHRWPSWEFGALAERLGVELPTIGATAR